MKTQIKALKIASDYKEHTDLPNDAVADVLSQAVRDAEAYNREGQEINVRQNLEIDLDGIELMEAVHLYKEILDACISSLTQQIHGEIAQYSGANREFYLEQMEKIARAQSDNQALDAIRELE